MRKFYDMSMMITSSKVNRVVPAFPAQWSVAGVELYEVYQKVDIEDERDRPVPHLRVAPGPWMPASREASRTRALRSCQTNA